MLTQPINQLLLGPKSMWTHGNLSNYVIKKKIWKKESTDILRSPASTPSCRGCARVFIIRETTRMQSVWFFQAPNSYD